jgi:hypothetical protein
VSGVIEDEDGAPYPEVYAVLDPAHDPILYLPYPGATGTGSKETAERIAKYNAHLGVRVVRCQLVPVREEPSRSTRSVGHPVVRHSDGVTCIKDGNGVWFTPYDAGGEGPNCDRPHELSLPEPELAPDGSTVYLPEESIAEQCIDWPLCGHGTRGCSP